jgi:DNA (cytosine-5)-methyltransferase 1
MCSPKPRLRVVEWGFGGMEKENLGYSSDMYFIDLFCGAGGTSSGAHMAGANVVACVNHDALAIDSHKINHPNAIHFTEDIRDFKVVKKLQTLVEKIRARNLKAVIVLWASLECTNHSNAKGGLPRDADSRSLAEHMYQYIEELTPDMFLVENVREFMAWGPLDSEKKPVSRTKGLDFLRWIKKTCSFGYTFDHKLLNSADYGACQSRTRLFIQFSKCGEAFWPKQTHAKTISKDSFLPPLRKWKPVRDILNLEDKGASIFKRKKPLVEATLRRIYTGLEKFVAGGESSFLHSYYSNGRAHSIKEPCNTLTTKDRFALVFVDQQYGNGVPRSIELPATTITTVPKLNIVHTEFLINPQYSSSGSTVNAPCFTLIARMDKSPPSLASVECGGPVIIYEGDSLMTLKIKKFMIAYGIKDIKTRMLQIPELLQIQGFPKDYKLVGTKAEQKKFIGNAVEVNNAKALIEAVRKGLTRKSQILKMVV